jgi:hypothetical protein
MPKVEGQLFSREEIGISKYAPASGAERLLAELVKRGLDRNALPRAAKLCLWLDGRRD